MTFYDKFAQMCRERFVSPSRAALDAGLSKATVSRWKKEPDAEPSGTVVKKLCDYFGVTPAELWQGVTTQPETSTNLADWDEARYAQVSFTRYVQLCASTGRSVTHVARELGVPKTALEQWRHGSLSTTLNLSAVADYFDVPLEYLFGLTDKRPDTRNIAASPPAPEEEISHEDILSIPGIEPLPHFVKKPRLGAIACGEPIIAIEDADEFDDVPKSIDCDFTLLCVGDSMINARIFDGDIVYIRSQPTVEDGEIAAVLIDDEATLKRVRRFADHIALVPENPMYKPLVYWGEEMNAVRILGKAVAFTSRIR